MCSVCAQVTTHWSRQYIPTYRKLLHNIVLCHDSSDEYFCFICGSKQTLLGNKHKGSCKPDSAAWGMWHVKRTEFWWGNLLEGGHLRDLRADTGRLQCICKKQHGGVLNELIWLRSGCCERGNELSGSIKCSWGTGSFSRRPLFYEDSYSTTIPCNCATENLMLRFWACRVWLCACWDG